MKIIIAMWCNYKVALVFIVFVTDINRNLTKVRKTKTRSKYVIVHFSQFLHVCVDPCTHPG